MTKVEELLEVARSCIGIPYLYGGTTKEKGFDCSGLCRYSYSQIGVTIPRVTYDQINFGTKITDKNMLDIGDLIFNIDSNGQAYHVFMYSGNGNVIEAKKTGTLISEHSKWKWDGVAVRILNSKEEIKMNIFLTAGHGLNQGQGAVGIVRESVEDRKIAQELANVLKELGHTVKYYNAEGSKDYVEETNIANQGSYDWYIDVHLNAYDGKANGVEALVYSDNKPQAHTISKNVSSLGFYNRGVKCRTDLYILKNTKAKALLVECFFCDSQKDIDIYNKVGARAIAIKIAEGLTGQTYNKTTTQPTPSTKPRIENNVFINGSDKLKIYSDTGLNIEVGYLIPNQRANSLGVIPGRCKITFELPNKDWLIGYVEYRE